MEKTEERLEFLKRRRSDRLINKPLWPEKEELGYLINFFKTKIGIVRSALFFLLAQGVLEVFLIVISHRYLKNSYLTLNNLNLLYLISLFSLLYLITAFLAVKKERLLIIRLINDVRSRWFKLFLHKRPEENNLEKKSYFIAKISYHLPLLATGLSNSLAGSIRLLLFLTIMVLLALIFNLKLFWFILGALILSISLGLLAAWVSYNYVTRETTFYSSIIRLMDFSLSDWQFVKKFKRERAVAHEFDELVELDTHFRVRRDLWLRFSASIVFILLIFLSFFASNMSNSIEYFFGTASFDTRFIVVVAFVYFSRLLYEAVRVGLYSIPLFLGLKLSTPRFKPRHLGKNCRLSAKLLEFKSTKNKLYKQAKIYQTFHYIFKRGGRYLLYSQNSLSRNSLAQVFSGLAVFGRRAWIIKSSGKRYFYNEFFDKYQAVFYLDPKFNSNRSILETILGKEKGKITDQEFIDLSNLVNSHKQLRDIFFEKEDWRFLASKFCISSYNIFLIQLLHCLCYKPYMMVIDSEFIRADEEKIWDLIKLTNKLLPETTLLIFGDRDNNKIQYDEVYSIEKNT